MLVDRIAPCSFTKFKAKSVVAAGTFAISPITQNAIKISITWLFWIISHWGGHGHAFAFGIAMQALTFVIKNLFLIIISHFWRKVEVSNTNIIYATKTEISAAISFCAILAFFFLLFTFLSFAIAIKINLAIFMSKTILRKQLPRTEVKATIIRMAICVIRARLSRKTFLQIFLII